MKNNRDKNKEQEIISFLTEECGFNFDDDESVEIKKYIQELVSDLNIFDRYLFDKEQDNKDVTKSIEFLVSLIEGDNVERES